MIKPRYPPKGRNKIPSESLYSILLGQLAFKENKEKRIRECLLTLLYMWHKLPVFSDKNATSSIGLLCCSGLWLLLCSSLWGALENSCIRVGRHFEQGCMADSQWVLENEGGGQLLLFPSPPGCGPACLQFQFPKESCAGHKPYLLF